MQAAYYGSAGPARTALKIGEQPTPVPAAGEVLVRVEVSGVNPSDVKKRGGSGRPVVFPLVIPHSDGAGVIEAVGEGVDPRRRGERVWIWNGQYGRAFGTAAEFIALPSDQAVHLLDELSFDVGACLEIPWLTAWRAVHYRPRVEAKEAILVTGGAGSVGYYAIQLAKRAGFRVITTISSDQKAEVARSAGADMVVNYKLDDVGAAVSVFTGGRGVDRLIEVDLAANAAEYTKLLRMEALAIV